MTAPLVITPLAGMPLLAAGDDVAGLIVAALGTNDLVPAEGDIVVVAQKIISKAEGRYVRLADVTPSPRAIELARIVGKDPRYIEVVLSEASDVVRTGPNMLIVTHRLGHVMANAGIDQSNIGHPDGEEQVLLLPRDPDVAAQALRDRLQALTGAHMGVVVNDSFGRPWRNGVTGVAIGAAGVPTLVDMVGEPDLFGRLLTGTEIAIGDEIAAAASLVMGQAAEGVPVVHMRGFRSTRPALPAAALPRARAKDAFR